MTGRIRILRFTERGIFPLVAPRPRWPICGVEMEGTLSGDRKAATEARCEGRTVRLKWHMLRRFADDPPFARGNLRDGLAAGASLEVDIRALACGHFVCLHDADLDRETTGTGAVADMDAATVSRLRMRKGGEPVLLLDEIVRMVRAGSTHPSAQVQLDLFGKVDTAAGQAFAASLRGVARGFLLNANDWDTVVRLGASVPGLLLGYDPTRAEGTMNNVTDVFRAVHGRAPEADWIYLRRDIVRESYERGDGLVDRLHASGHLVDCWTIDQGTADATDDFLAAVNAGCDQITTNTAHAWADSKLD